MSIRTTWIHDFDEHHEDDHHEDHNHDHDQPAGENGSEPPVNEVEALTEQPSSIEETSKPD